MPRTFTYLAALLAAITGSNAIAQNAGETINVLSPTMRAALVEHVRTEWSKVPPNEIPCIERRLRQQGTSTTRLIQNGVAPADPKVSIIRAGCRPLAAALPDPRESASNFEDFWAKRTFDCTKARSATARIICLDQAGTRADWDLAGAYWARHFSLDEIDRRGFDQAHDDWLRSLPRTCIFQPSQSRFSSAQEQCVLAAYRRRADSYRSLLSGDAIYESRLSSEQRAEIQTSLIALNLLDDIADGQFGPNTRAAISRFQAQSGFPQSKFLTAQQQRQIVQLKMPVRVEQSVSSSAAPPSPPLSALPASPLYQAIGPTVGSLSRESALALEAPVTDCDRYAASEFDPQRKVTGVPFDKINPTLAVPACEDAVQQFPNISRLTYQLGYAYYKASNFTAALQQFRKAADLGSAMAQDGLGDMYMTGVGVPRDYRQAVVWYGKAADQGVAAAQTNLGNMYRNGYGVVKDNEQAVAWYRKAADQGSAMAETGLGFMYSNGLGVPQDHQQAVAWYREAADHGVAAAQFSLGLAYESGNGVSQDNTQSVAWYRKAAEQGYEEAKAKLLIPVPYLPRTPAAVFAPDAAQQPRCPLTVGMTLDSRPISDNGQPNPLLSARAQSIAKEVADTLQGATVIESDIVQGPQSVGRLVGEFRTRYIARLGLSDALRDWITNSVSDDLIGCFPALYVVAGEFASHVRTATGTAQQKLAEVAAPSILPASVLGTAYAAYIDVKRCYDARGGYSAIYISGPEMEQAKIAVQRIEQATRPRLGPDNTTDDVWLRVVQTDRNFQASGDYAEGTRFLCQGRLAVVLQILQEQVPASATTPKDF